VFHVKTSALSAVTERHRLSRVQLGQLAALLDRIARDDRAPTTVRDFDSAVGVHVADSLAALELDTVREASRVADLGAGAGFPGLPLAIALPGVRMSLVESQSRKCDFIASIAREVSLTNARVVCARVEEWSDGGGAQDVVLARALASGPVVLEYAAPLLRLGGSLVDWRGRRNAGEEAASLLAADELGLRLAGVHHVHPFPGALNHHLHVYEKVRDTPDRFPRRAGVARKRPLQKAAPSADQVVDAGSAT
jgi:16S rRNA (guanine527-N7)-methyltransferase